MEYYLQDRFYVRDYLLNDYPSNAIVQFEPCETQEKLSQKKKTMELLGGKFEWIEEGKMCYTQIDSECTFSFLGDKLILPSKCDKMFSNINVYLLDLEHVDFSNVKSLKETFSGSSIHEMKFDSDINTSSVTDMKFAFSFYKGKLLDLSSMEFPNLTNGDFCFAFADIDELRLGENSMFKNFPQYSFTKLKFE